MDRWELKLVCAAISFIIGLICTFIPFNLSLVSCQPCRKKFRHSKGKFSPKVESIEKDVVDNAPGHIINNDFAGASDARNNFPISIESSETEGGKVESNRKINHDGVNKTNFTVGVNEKNDQNGNVENLLNEKVLDIMLCFGGGVFFGTFLLHVLPEVKEILTEALTEPQHIYYPVPEILIGAGFFLILLTDQLVSYFRQMSFNEKLTKLNANSSVRISTSNSENIEVLETDLPANSLSLEHSHHHNTRSIILVLALSLHHIFEGLSIGLQKHFNNVWQITLAVMCHETAICFSMGLQFFKTDRKLTTKVAIILVISTVILPLGILIGTGITEIGNKTEFKVWQDIVNGVLQALACGTFVYVTFFEIFYEQLGRGKTTFLKIFFIIAGFSFMALLGLLPVGDEYRPGHHHHDHDHDHDQS